MSGQSFRQVSKLSHTGKLFWLVRKYVIYINVARSASEIVSQLYQSAQSVK